MATAHLDRALPPFSIEFRDGRLAGNAAIAFMQAALRPSGAWLAVFFSRSSGNWGPWKTAASREDPGVLTGAAVVHGHATAATNGIAGCSGGTATGLITDEPQLSVPCSGVPRLCAKV
jgi:hypothetical protein